MSNQYNFIDLFCGCGGFSLGFRQAGFAARLGIDLWSDAAKTYKHNFPESVVLNEDIKNVSGGKIAELAGLSGEDIDVIIGGPPCQGFSLSGKRNENDPRNELYKSFVSIVGALKPKIFVMENVPGLVRLFDGKALEGVMSDFSSLGYQVSYSILSADNYGVPQQRKRVFFVGVNKSKIKKTPEFKFPGHTNGNGTDMPPVTCKDAISDLDFIPDDHVLGENIDYRLSAMTDYQARMRLGSARLLNHSATLHTERTKEIIAMVPDGENYKSLPKELWDTRKVNIAWTRMASGKPCFTIDTGHNHHFHYRANRVPTVRESARIQSFPDTFEFTGIKTSQLKQVGNAVPPMLAQAIARQVKAILDKERLNMYDHTRQYRCAIIRGKSQTEMDNLLPTYAKIVDEVCPCRSKEFASAFENALKTALPGVRKTVANHRTEMAGKTFGMYYTSEDGNVYPSERALKFLSDWDTPALFKDICYKMQFPSGSQKPHTVRELISDGIRVRQFPFVLKVLLLAKKDDMTLTKKEIGYYILNSLDVLQGKADPVEVLEAIKSDRRRGIARDAGKGSHDSQHLKEQIKLLELANLVIVNGGKVALNPLEMPTIEIFADEYATPPEFDVYSYDLDSKAGRKAFALEWDYYFSTLSDKAPLFDTTAEALGITAIPPADEEKDTAEKGAEEKGRVKRADAADIGDEGERYVFEYEKQRVAKYNPRLARKVIHLGKTRGLGYDIQSVVAEPGDDDEFVKYIEVKATKRVTAPNIKDDNWVDTLNITRNEWVAAQQHKGSYSIFRVYFVRGAVVMFVITDIAQKHKDGVITAVPTNYRIDFGNGAVDQVILPAGGGPGDA